MKLNLTRNIRPRAALAVVVLVLLASVVAGRERPDHTQVAEPVRQADLSAIAAPAADLDLDRLQRPNKEETVPDLFAPPVPSAPPATAAQPAAPSIPPLPFRYLAKVVDGRTTQVFVAQGDEPHAIHKGETIDGLYKVERVTESAVTFKHLPSGTRQTLPISALN